MEMTIGANIKRLRTQKNITQEQLSVAMNVTCAAVSKWERGETYPDITLLQPLAFFFSVTLDELMGYDQEKVQAEIEQIIELYRQHWNDETGREIIVKAYRDYPNDYWIMHYYMWNVAGDLADNDPEVLIAHKDEFFEICNKILQGCTEERIRLGAWNMRAKILHAQGKTDEALDIYRTKFMDWYTTGEQKTEQLFAKDTDEYYYHVQKNMYELIDFASDKLGRSVFFNPSLSMEQKTQRALEYGNLMISAFEQTGEAYFLMMASAFLGRIENDLAYRGGTDEQIIAVMDKHLYAMQKIENLRPDNDALNGAFERYGETKHGNLFKSLVHMWRNATGGRRAELLKNADYCAVLSKYQSQ